MFFIKGIKTLRHFFLERFGLLPLTSQGSSLGSLNVRFLVIAQYNDFEAL